MNGDKRDLYCLIKSSQPFALGIKVVSPIVESLDKNPRRRISVHVSVSVRVDSSTDKLKCARKSAPIIGISTSAIVKVHVYSLRRPILRDVTRSPYVFMDVPFAACNFSWACLGIIDNLLQ